MAVLIHTGVRRQELLDLTLAVPVARHLAVNPAVEVAQIPV